MKIEDLKGRWASLDDNPILMQHVNNKTIQFWPTGIIQSVGNSYRLHGYWIAIQTGEPVVQETIIIKKADLANWNIVGS